MPVLIAERLPMSDEQRAELEMVARSTSLPHRQVVQATGAADYLAVASKHQGCATP